MQSCRTLDWLSLKKFRKNVLLPRFQKQIIKKKPLDISTQFWPVTCVIE